MTYRSPNFFQDGAWIKHLNTGETPLQSNNYAFPWIGFPLSFRWEGYGIMLKYDSGILGANETLLLFSTIALFSSGA